MYIKNSGDFSMERRDDAFISDAVVVGGMAFLVICGILGCIAYGLITHKSIFWFIQSTILLFIILVWLIIVILIFYDRGKAKYKVTEEGLWTSYPFQSLRLIPWSEFQEVCVCYAIIERKYGSDRYVIVCFVKHGMTKDYKGRWNTESIFTPYRNLISVDYTYELHDELKEKCPLGVLDLRDTPEYAIK